MALASEIFGLALIPPWFCPVLRPVDAASLICVTEEPVNQLLRTLF